jgi:hypothetical protein
LPIKANDLFPEKQEKDDIRKGHHVQDSFVDSSCGGTSALLVRLWNQTALGASLCMHRTGEYDKKQDAGKQKEVSVRAFHSGAKIRNHPEA